jgi:hypothetical protein
LCPSSSVSFLGIFLSLSCSKPLGFSLHSFSIPSYSVNLPFKVFIFKFFFPGTWILMPGPRSLFHFLFSLLVLSSILLTNLISTAITMLISALIHVQFSAPYINIEIQ